jgi:two-component system, chemotaxis family, chemotaxis protein CheY
MARILVVDDAAFLRAMLRDILESAGHVVLSEAANGLEAVDKYKSFRPDIVTMDITMPVMEGIEALREIKSIDPHAKVVMCSALGQKNVIMDAIRYGANDFIVKPFQAARVIEAVDKTMSAVH